MQLSAHPEPTAAWRELRTELRRAVGESTYEIWLEPLELLAIREDKLLLGAPPATESWVAKRFGRILESCARLGVRERGRGRALELGPRRRETGRTVDRQEVVLDLDAGALNPRYSFEQFIIGDGNRLAHAAALAVAELPGQAYNPLFLHAPPGLGKTHLLHAIGNYVRAFGGGTRVRYTTVEAFTNQFIRALGSRSLDRFKQAYRDADVLLIDDVQFLASKAKTEEEFFHTFNALYETGRQLRAHVRPAASPADRGRGATSGALRVRPRGSDRSRRISVRGSRSCASERRSTTSPSRTKPCSS